MDKLPFYLFLVMVFAFVYGLFFISFFFRNKALFGTLLLGFVFFYDVVFINLSYVVSSTVLFLLKSWQEYLTLFLLLAIIISRRYRTMPFAWFDVFYILLLCGLTVAGALAAIKNHIALGELFLGWRMYLLPFVWGYLLHKSGVFAAFSAKAFFKVVIGCCLVNVLFAAYEDAGFTGSLKGLWFYAYIDKLNPIDEHLFDFIRDGSLRATGGFVSPLIYSIVLALGLIMMSNYLLYAKRKMANDLLAAVGFLVLWYGLQLSHTRIGFIIFFIGMVVGLLRYWWPRAGLAMLAALPVGIAVMTFLLLLLGFTDDLSALGRLIQYRSLPGYFSLLGSGFGSGETNVFFDSYYISIAVLFGVFTLGVAWFFLLLFKAVVDRRLIVAAEGDFYQKAVYYGIAGYCFSFLYIFAFHFTAGSAAYQLFVLSTFYFLSYYPRRTFQLAAVKNIAYA